MEKRDVYQETTCQTKRKVVSYSGSSFDYDRDKGGDRKRNRICIWKTENSMDWKYMEAEIVG